MEYKNPNYITNITMYKITFVCIVILSYIALLRATYEYDSTYIALPQAYYKAKDYWGIWITVFSDPT